ncbi:MAG: ABC transporter ATP-binding protein [Pseudomonadales bacterium]
MRSKEPQEHPQSFSTLWSLTAGQRRRYLLAIGAMVATNLFMFAPPLLGKYAIDTITAEDFSHAAPVLGELALSLSGTQAAAEPLFTPQLASYYLWLSAAAAVLLTLFAGYFTYTRGRLAALASEGIVRQLRERIYGHLHDLPAPYYDSADTGDLVQRASSDVETVRVFMASDVVEIGRSLILVICVVPVLFYLNSTLAWYSLMLMPLLVLGAYLFFQRVKAVFQVTDEAEAELTATLQENLTGIRVVRAFNRQEYEIDRFAGKNAFFRDQNHRLIVLMGLYWGTSDFFALIQIGIVLFLGGYLVVDGTMTVGTLFAFMTYEAMVIWPVRQLGRVLTDSGKAVVSLGRINEVLSSEPEAARPVPATSRVSGAININALSFSYGDAVAVRNLTISIAAGETIGIVGAPGSGKSTLIRLLLGLYPYQQGTMQLDGIEIRDSDRHWLRQQISVVLQDPFLYSRSIRQNLLVGKPDASGDELDSALQDAAVVETLAKFNAGLDAAVGERGVTLSGGQRQRLALARALLKQPPVLILDDSLSAVDLATEAHILEALQRRAGAQTTLIVAHRLSSLAHADRIMVMQDGAIVQVGHHNELAQTPGPYQKLCELQLALDAEVASDITRSVPNSTETQP